MQEIPKTDFNTREEGKLLKNWYIDACFTDIVYQLFKAWELDQEIFACMREKILNAYNVADLLGKINAESSDEKKIEDKQVS